MLKRFSTKYALFTLLLDVLAFVSAFLVATILRRVLPFGSPFREVQLPLPLILIAIALWVVIAFTVSLYEPKRVYKVIDEFQILSFAHGLFWLGTAGLLFFTFRFTSRLLVVYAIFASFIFPIVWRIIMRTYFRKQLKSTPEFMLRRRVLILGAGEVGHRVVETIVDFNWAGLDFVGFLDDNVEKQQNSGNILGNLDDVEDIVRREQIDDVILALPSHAHKRLNAVVSMLHELPVNVRIIPDYFNLALFRATVEDFGGIPMISLRDPVLNEYQRLIKRLFD